MEGFCIQHHIFFGAERWEYLPHTNDVSCLLHVFSASSTTSRGIFLEGANEPGNLEQKGPLGWASRKLKNAVLGPVFMCSMLPSSAAVHVLNNACPSTAQRLFHNGVGVRRSGNNYTPNMHLISLQGRWRRRLWNGAAMSLK